MTEPRRIGSYLEVDETGRLRSRAGARNVRPPWSEAVAALVIDYLERFGDEIHSVYVRGSVAAGLAIEGFSDLDSFAVMKPGVALQASSKDLANWQLELDERFRRRYPFLDGVEASLLPIDQVVSRGEVFNFILATESACVHGPDLTAEVTPYEVGPEIAFQTRFFGRDLAYFLAEYPNEPEVEKPGFIAWLLRRFLRLGMELVMVEEGRYTRDIYLCYEGFSKHYPAQSPEMRKALELALRPIQEQETDVFIRSFGSWLQAESERKLRAWGYGLDAKGTWAQRDRGLWAK